MPDIVATAGSASANSFATEDQFADYLDTRLNVGTYSTVNKQKALISATREISLLPFNGERVNGTQALSWPRADCPNPDSPAIDTVYGDTLADFAEDEIPQRVIDATCELAFEFLRAGTTDVSALDSTANIKSETVGPLSTTYFDAVDRKEGISRFPLVLKYVLPLLKRSARNNEISRV